LPPLSKVDLNIITYIINKVMKNFILSFFLILFSLKIYPESYNFTKIVDIGNSLKSFNENIFITEIGFFYDDADFTPFKIFDKNIKKISKTDSLISILFYDNTFEIYKIDSSPILLFSNSFDSTIDDIFSSKDYFLFKNGTIFYLYRFEKDSLKRIRHFNLTGIDGFYSDNDNLFFILNDGEIVKYGKVEGDSFIIKNFVLTNNSKFLYFNKFSTIISNSTGKYLYFFCLRDDSLKLLYEVPDNRVYENGFSVDSFLILKSSDSLFIRSVIDSFITYSVDSFQFEYPIKDIFLKEDTIFINTGVKIIKYSLSSKIFKLGKNFSKSYEGILRGDVRNGFYSEDSLFIFSNDTIVETINKNKNLLKKDNLLLCYDQIIFSNNDSFNFISTKNPVKNIKMIDGQVYFIENDNFLKKLNFFDSSIETILRVEFDMTDFEKTDSNFYFSSGQNGILKIDSNGGFKKSYLDGSYFQKVVEFKGMLFSIKNGNMISTLDKENLLEFDRYIISDFIDWYNYDDTLLIFLTEDSVLLYKDSFEKVNFNVMNLKNIKDILLEKNGVYIILKNCATLFFEKNVSLLKDDDKRGYDNNLSLKNEKIWYDILGRKVSRDFKVNGFYFIKQKNGTKKIFNIK